MDILITTIATAMITILITWPISRHFARQTSKENKLILESLEQGGLVQYTRDKNGKIQGRVVTGAAKMQSKSKFTASAE